MTDQRTGGQQNFARQLLVQNQPLEAGHTPVVRGRRGMLARFLDGNPLAEPGDFTIRVRAGDRTFSGRVVRDGSRGFAVVTARRLPASAQGGSPHRRRPRRAPDDQRPPQVTSGDKVVAIFRPGPQTIAFGPGLTL